MKAGTIMSMVALSTSVDAVKTAVYQATSPMSLQQIAKAARVSLADACEALAELASKKLICWAANGWIKP